jgi:hypothetical protein
MAEMPYAIVMITNVTKPTKVLLMYGIPNSLPESTTYFTSHRAHIGVGLWKFGRISEARYSYVDVPNGRDACGVTD